MKKILDMVSYLATCGFDFLCIFKDYDFFELLIKEKFNLNVARKVLVWFPASKFNNKK